MFSNSPPMSGQPLHYVSPLVLLRNSELIAWTRTLMTIVCGMVTGVLGITGAWGGLCFLLSHALVSLALLARLRFQPASYFPMTTPLSFVVSGAGDSVLLFVLFWALGYAARWVF